MITRLLDLLHRNPIVSTGTLLVIGMGLILANMVFLSDKMNEETAERYAENYIQALNQFQAQYSSNVVARVKEKGVQARSDYHDHPGTIPIPATFGIELADALTNPKTGIRTRLYSDYPFSSRTNGGPHDEFEALALTKLRFAADKDKPYVSYEKVGGRHSLRYAKAILMQQSCVDCHNSHPDSPKKDWKVGQVRGARSVTFPLDSANQGVHKGWAVTLAVMLLITTAGLGIIFLVVQALRTSIDMLSKTNTAINRFVPHEFLRYLDKKNIIDVQLNDSIETQLTVLFSDIRSFTDLSECMTPEENFKFINDYLKVMGPIVRRNNGYIDKYIGDAIMALFDNQDDAMRAAMEMLKVLETYNVDHLKQRLLENYDVGRLSHENPISIGIGLHKGKVRLGTIGEHGRMDGTVISDAVNLASRIEALTKLYGVQCLITEAIFRSLSQPDLFLIRFIDKVKVKGKKVPVNIYEVFSADPTEIKAKKRAIKGRFEEATRLYAVKEFARARALFEQVIAEFPEDRASQSYLLRCNRYMNQELGDDWDGSFHLDSK